MSKQKRLKDFIEGEASEKRIAIEDLLREIIDLLEEVSEKLNALDSKLTKIEEKLSELEFVSKPTERGFKRVELLEELLEKMKEKGYIKESEDLGRLREKGEILERLKKLGAVELVGTKERYLVHPKKYREFELRLVSIRDSDPSIASEKMGEFKELFIDILREGLIYFDSKNKVWKRVE